MKIELSNGQLKFWQWDAGQKVQVPENVPTVHLKFGKSAVELPVLDRWVDVPDELLQTGNDILLWTYDEDHTLDAVRIPVEKRLKPADYVYTPTEIKTWESLDARIEALEKGGGVAGVTSVNGKTGAVKLTAEDVGAASEEYVNNNSKLFVINITDSLNDSNDKVYSADKTYSEILEALNNGLLPVCKMPKHITGSYVYGLCYFSGKLTPPIGSDRFFFRSLDTDALNSNRTVVSINPSNYVEVTSEPVVMTGATDSRSGMPGYVPVPQSSERNYFLRGDAKWKPALQPPAIASVGQYLSVKTVDNKGIVTETEAVDAPSAGDLSLGLTGATVGQTVKISAVDVNGVPTAWEPVDMGGGAEAEEFVREIPLTADVGVYVLADLSIYKKVRFIIKKTYKKEGAGTPFLKIFTSSGVNVFRFYVGENPIQYMLSEHIFECDDNGRLNYSTRYSNNEISQVLQYAAVSKFVDAGTKFGNLRLDVPTSFLASVPDDAKITVYGVRA